MEQTVEYAGFWRRVAACCIDLILSAPLYGLLYFIFAEHRIIGESIFGVLLLVAYGWFFSSQRQATPGMRVMNFHVCDVHGKRISFGRAVWWMVTGLIGWAIACAGLLYIQSNYDIDAINQCVSGMSLAPVDPNIDCSQIDTMFGAGGVETFMMWSWIALGMFTVLMVVWSLSIGLSKQKSGFHNLICATRFVKGAAPKPAA